MIKRILMILMVLVLAASFIYAENNVLFATVSPVSIQTVNTSWNTTHISDYGWGVKAGYRRFVGPVLFGTDLTYMGFVKSTTEYPLTNVQLMAKVGGKVSLADNCDLNCDIGGGVVMGVSRSVINFLPVVAGSCSLSTYFNSDMAVVVGADLSVTWPKSKGSSYTANDWAFGINFGVEYDF